MFSRLAIGWSLMALSVMIHAVGLSVTLRWLRELGPPPQLWTWTWLFVRLAGWIVLLHLIEIAIWGGFYVWLGALAGMQDALYFSAVTYTTTGYGDIVLPREWRLVGAIEALTGILMCGWSTGFFFAIVSRMFSDRPRPIDRPI
jgi:hypothetical protein